MHNSESADYRFTLINDILICLRLHCYYIIDSKRRVIIKGTAEQIASALSQIEDKVHEYTDTLEKLVAGETARSPRGKISPRIPAVNPTPEIQLLSPPEDEQALHGTLKFCSNFCNLRFDCGDINNRFFNCRRYNGSLRQRYRESFTVLGTSSWSRDSASWCVGRSNDCLLRARRQPRTSRFEKCN